LEPKFGAFIWCLYLEPIFGAYIWSLYLEPIFGASCVGARGGFCSKAPNKGTKWCFYLVHSWLGALLSGAFLKIRCSEVEGSEAPEYFLHFKQLKLVLTNIKQSLACGPSHFADDPEVQNLVCSPRPEWTP
jgi:hypothetical protein